MRKRRWILAGTLLTMGSLAVLLDPTCVLLGFLRREPFYQRRPATYWSRRIQQLRPNPESHIVWIKRLREHLLPEEHLTKEAIPVLAGNAEARPVLWSLLQDTVPLVRSTAAFALIDAGAAKPQDVIPALCDALLDEECYETRGTRALAASILEDLGPDARAAIPALIVALADRRDRVSYVAERTLERLGPVAVPALITAMSQSDRSIRMGAVCTLGYIGLEARPAVPALLEALKDRSMCLAAAYALWEMDVEDEQVVTALLQALQDADHEIRAEAARVLGEIGTEANGIVPALHKALQDERADVRSEAGKGLAEFGVQARVALPALIRGLQDKDSGVRSSCASALEALGPSAKGAVEALIEALNSSETNVRASAIRALAAIGPRAKQAVPDLTKALEEPTLAYDAAEALGRIGPDADAAIPALLRAMKDPDKDGSRSLLRAAATSALGDIQPKDEGSIRALIAAWKDDSEQVASRATKAIAAIGPVAIPSLSAAMKSEDRTVRRQAVICMAEMAQKFEEAIPPLRQAIEDPDIHIRVCAAVALSKVDPRYEKLVPALCEILQTRSSAWEVFTALASIGRDAKGAVSILLELLKDDSLAVDAAHALWKIDPSIDAIVPALLKQLRGEDQYWRSGAAYSLGELGSAAESAIPALVEALGDKSNWRLRTAAADALAKIGPAAAAAIPALVEALNDNNPMVLERAAEALGSFGPSASDALLVLRKVRDGEIRKAQTEDITAYDWDQAITNARAKAIKAIWQINGIADEAVPRLILLLKHPDEFSRRLAADALALIGPEARVAVPALVWAMKHGSSNYEVAPAAAAALGAIGPDAKAAIPALIKAFKKRNPTRTFRYNLFGFPAQGKLAAAAGAALMKIDPEAARKAGVSEDVCPR